MASPPSSLPETCALNTKANKSQAPQHPFHDRRAPQRQRQEWQRLPRPPAQTPPDPPAVTVRRPQTTPLGSTHPTSLSAPHTQSTGSAGTLSAELPEPNTLCFTSHNPLYHPRSRCPVADGLERLLSIYYVPDPALSSMCTDLPSPYKVSAVITSNLPMKRLRPRKLK